MPKSRNDLVAWMRSHADVREQPKGSNRHPLIDAWLTRIGSPLGSAWCAAVVHAGGDALYGSAWPFRQSGRVQDVVDAAKKKQLVREKITDAKVGDLIAFYFPSLKRYAHIAVLEHDIIKTRIRTIDGNTVADDAGDSREGWGVFPKNRLLLPTRMIALTYPEGFFDV